ncbi:hypothetical protein Mapa_012028 [Marchantia paleacea]|nr:hypothetical protein Mapa_012028 [Marchantia paleacea]
MSEATDSGEVVERIRDFKPRKDVEGVMCGAPRAIDGEQEKEELKEIGHYAVREHNTKHGKKLKFGKIVSGTRQLVAGTLYRLVIEASDEEDGADAAGKLFEATVYHRQWENHRSLEHFQLHEPAAQA